MTEQVQRDADTRGLYLKAYHQDRGFRTGRLFSCLMFHPAERALSGSDLCPSEPKPPSHSIMWSGCLSLSETEACRVLGLGHFRGGRAGAGAGDNGDWGLCNSGPCPPLSSSPNNGIAGMPNLSSFARGSVFLLEALFPDGRSC